LDQPLDKWIFLSGTYILISLSHKTMAPFTGIPYEAEELIEALYEEFRGESRERFTERVESFP
jgi:hypothetical protein